MVKEGRRGRGGGYISLGKQNLVTTTKVIAIICGSFVEKKTRLINWDSHGT
jgi:hypothetical protein